MRVLKGLAFGAALVVGLVVAALVAIVAMVPLLPAQMP